MMSESDINEFLDDEEATEEKNIEEAIWLDKSFDPQGYYSIYVTCDTLDEAQEIGEKLIASRVAACVNIIPRMVSIYEWRDKLQKSNEAVMFVKTRGEKVKDVIAMVKKLHSYDVPAILVLPIKGGYLPYLHWVEEQTTPKEKEASNRATSGE